MINKLKELLFNNTRVCDGLFNFDERASRIENIARATRD